MVLVNTCVVHLGINKLYCIDNLYEKEYYFVAILKDDITHFNIHVQCGNK